MNNPTPSLNAALAKAKAEIPAILANRTVKIPTKAGREITFTYAELEEILPSVTPILSSNGLAIAHQMGFVEGKYCLISTLRHESGEQLESLFLLPSDFADPKDLGVKISYGRRYNTLCLLDVTVVEPNSRDWEETKRKVAKEIKQEAGLIQKPSNPKEGSILHDMSGISPQKTVSPLSRPQPPKKEAGLPMNGQPDRNLLNTEIESVMKRKGISTDQARAILQELFNARGRQQLSDKQLQEFLEYLQSSIEVKR